MTAGNVSWTFVPAGTADPTVQVAVAWPFPNVGAPVLLRNCPVVALTSETVWFGMTLPVGSATVIVPALAASAPVVVNSASYVTPATPAAVEDSVTVGEMTEDACAAPAA